MKKVFITLLAMAMCIGSQAQYVHVYNGDDLVQTIEMNDNSKLVFRTNDLTVGTVPAYIDDKLTEIEFVQLWEGGPYFSKYNFGCPATSEESMATDKGEAVMFNKKWDSWGKFWKIPSKSDFDGLFDNTKVKLERWQFNGVHCCKFTGNTPGYTDNVIYLPYGEYWTSDTEEGSSLFRDKVTYMEVTELSNNIELLSGYREALFGAITADYFYIRPVIVPGMAYKTSAKTIGVTSVTGTDNSRESVPWVQLWENGPKFAEFNLGSTITSYAGQKKYNENNTAAYAAAVGGYYQWGATEDLAKTDFSNTGFSDLAGKIDMATEMWGEPWHTPTAAQMDSLVLGFGDRFPACGYGDTIKGTLCTWLWCDGMVNQYEPGCLLQGWKVSGVGDYKYEHIFLPAAGYADFAGESTAATGQDMTMEYWTSTKNADGTAYVFGKVYDENTGIAPASVSSNRNNAYPVRPCISSKTLVSGLNITNKITDMPNDQAYQLTVEVTPASASNKVLKWQSSNTAAATVDQNGKITAVANGKTTITATATDGSGVSTSFEITICAWRGVQAITGTDTNRTECGWVRLWPSGPKFAEFNVGSSATSYDGLTLDAAYVGYVYALGNSTPSTPNTIDDIHGFDVELTATSNPVDPVITLWGNAWRLPSKSDIDVSYYGTNTSVWTVKGQSVVYYEVRSVLFPDYYIILPSSKFEDDRYYGRYWTRNINADWGAYEYSWYFQHNSLANRRLSVGQSSNYQVDSYQSLRAVLAE